MKYNQILLVRIAILAFLFIGITACVHIKDQNDIFYSIPLLKSNSAKLNFSILTDNKDLIPLYADQFGKSPARRSDLFAEFKAAWSDEGLWIFCQVNDDRFYADTTSPWKSDAIEIFLAPYRGSNDIIQLTILPRNSPEFTDAFISTKSYRTTDSIRKVEPGASASSKRSGNTTEYIVRIPLKGLGIIPAIGTGLAIQLYINDSDSKSESLKNQLQWYPVGHSYDNSLAMYDLVFSENGTIFPKETSKCYIKDNDSVIISIYSNTLKNAEFIINKNNKVPVFSGSISSFPVSFTIPMVEINPDRDTLKVFLNNKIISIHDLFNVPRIYEKLEAPGGFEREIRFFEAQDRKTFPPENAILFIGSSSIKRWDNIKNYFPDKKIIHRGFGGSTAADALFYIKRIVLNYKPSKIVYYEGDNDIAKGISTEKIIAEIDSFVTIVHASFPVTQIFILPAKPSYARYRLWNKFLDLNDKIKGLSNKYSFVSYIDIVTPMFDEKGILRKDIFVEDSLHLNEKGYQIWGQTIRKAMGFQ